MAVTAAGGKQRGRGLCLAEGSSAATGLQTHRRVRRAVGARATPPPRPGAARATHRAGGRAGAGRTGRPAAGPAGWPPRRARSGCSRRRPGCCSAPAAAASPPGRPRSPPGPAAAPVAGDGGGSVTRSAVTVTAAECPLDPRGDAPSATRKWVPLGVLGKSASPGPLRPCPR